MCEIVTKLVVNSLLVLCSCIYFGMSSVISYMGIEHISVDCALRYAFIEESEFKLSTHVYMNQTWLCFKFFG